MSKNAKKVRVTIVNPLPGSNTSTTLSRARRYVRDGKANWNDQGQLVLRHINSEKAATAAAAGHVHHHHTGSRHQAPSLPPKVYAADSDAERFSRDSMGGFLRYPPPSMSTGSRFPALEKAGAGFPLWDRR